MKEGLQKFIKTTFAIAAFGVGAVNIVNGTMLMHDMYRDVHPRDFEARLISPKEETDEEVENNEDGT